MKHLLYFLGFIIFSISCDTIDNDYKLENKILNCFYKHHKDINIIRIVDSIETVFVKYDILTDKSAASYIRFIQQIKDNQRFNINNPDLVDEINSFEYLPSGIFCRDTTFITPDTTKLKNSKVYFIIDLFDKIQASGDISITMITESILDTFSEKDFENEYYRTLGLIMLANHIKIADYDNQWINRIVRDNKRNDLINNNDLLKIIVKSKKIIVNEEDIELSNLRDIAIRFLLETSNKEEIEIPNIGRQMKLNGIISLRSEETSFEFYISVQNELVLAFNAIRNDYSKRIFNSSFHNLDKNRSEIIKSLVPLSISETEPRIN